MAQTLALPVVPADAAACHATHPSEWVPEASKYMPGTNVLFINMPLREGASPNNIPLGPALMASRLRELGADVSILDLNAKRPHLSVEATQVAIEDHINEHGEPHVVGMSGLITTYGWQETVAKQVRGIAPDTYLVSGGGLASDLSQHILRWIPELDAVSFGEGDDIMIKIAADGRIIHDRGWSFRDRKDDRRRIHSPDSLYTGNRPRDLDALPFPAWDLTDLETYLPNAIWGLGANNSSAAPFTMERSMNTVSSRGCPFACRYCDRNGQGGRNYGVRSAENLAEEAKILMDRYGIDFLGVTDDNAMVLAKRLEAMIEPFAPLVARGLTWGTHGRLDEAADFGRKDGTPPRIQYMVESGCVYIGFGAESAHPEVLDAMGKGGKILKHGMTAWGGEEFPTTMIDGLMNCYEYGIHPNCTWIMGFPGETLDQLKTSVRFIEMMDQKVPDGANNHAMFVATAYPGTEMFKMDIVQSQLRKGFGMTTFGPEDEVFQNYVRELGDATKAIEGPGGLLNYSQMPDDQFMEARGLIDEGRIFDVLSL